VCVCVGPWVSSDTRDKDAAKYLSRGYQDAAGAPSAAAAAGTGVQTNLALSIF